VKLVELVVLPEPVALDDPVLLDDPVPLVVVPVEPVVEVPEAGAALSVIVPEQSAFTV
jgi:hypothetical protein